jgi:hypothetical protein
LLASFFYFSTPYWYFWLELQKTWYSNLLLKSFFWSSRPSLLEFKVFQTMQVD